MFCQVCGSHNDDELEYCRFCHQKLLVISGSQAIDDQEAFDSHPEEQFSFDEHLLERISILEEVVKRTTEAVRHALGTLYKLEQQILVNQTGVSTLRDLLEQKRLIAHEEWSELWESRMDVQLLALEKRERFAAIRERIDALYRGDELDAFRELLEEAENALLGLDIGGALGALDRALDRDPGNHELAFFLGETYFNEGAGERALDYFERVLAVKADHFESLVYGGVLYHESRDPTRAESLLKRALALYPETFLPAFSLGAVYAVEGRLAEASLLLERAVAIEPLPQALYLLGRCSWEMGRVGAAIRHLQEVVRKDPAFEEAYQILGLAYLDRRWFKKAAGALLDAQRLHPKRLHYYELVRLLAPRTDAASGLLDGLLEPGELAAEAADCVHQAEGALAGGELAEALSGYRRALGQQPDHPLLLLAYALTCLELGRAGEIEGTIEKLVELAPSERLRTTAYATLLEALRFAGKVREGNRLGRRLLDELDTDFGRTVAYFELALNLAEIEEDLDDALDFARRAVELADDKTRPLSLAALGWVHYKRRELSQAVEHLQSSSELEASSRTYHHLGLALLAVGRRDDARRALVEARRLEEETLGQRMVLECLKDGARRLTGAFPS